MNVDKKAALIVGSVAVACLDIGFLTGYLFAKKRFEVLNLETGEIESDDSEPIASANTVKYDTPAHTIDVPLDKPAEEALAMYQGITPDFEAPEPKEEASQVEEEAVVPPPVTEMPVKKELSPGLSQNPRGEVKYNIFERAKGDHPVAPGSDDNVMGTPVAYNPVHGRSGDDRYDGERWIISHDEFMENEPEHDQTVITYYEGDGVLADERDVPIDDIDRMVGDDNIVRFGHMSREPNLLYIRNKRIRMDFEIHRSEGSYAKEVMGFGEKNSGRIR